MFFIPHFCYGKPYLILSIFFFPFFFEHADIRLGVSKEGNTPYSNCFAADSFLSRVEISFMIIYVGELLLCTLFFTLCTSLYLILVCWILLSLQLKVRFLFLFLKEDIALLISVVLFFYTRISVMSKTDDGPLPRYRFYRKTQRWRPEKGNGGVSHDGGNNAGKEKISPPFVSSFDYALRRNYVVQQPDKAKRKGHDQQREETYREINRFQARHVLAGAQTITVTEKESSDDENSIPSEIDAEYRESMAALPPSVEFANPLMGYVSGFPLPKIYETICKLKRRELEGDETNLASVRLNFEEFRTLVSTIGDPQLLSRAYLRKIFCSLPTYASSTSSVQAFEFFSYIVENTYHPSLNRNVAMLFLAFGQDNELIPLVSLHSRVVLAWAEQNTFGNLRGEWTKLAQALETLQREIFEDKLIVRHSLYLNPEEVRALFCSQALLWKVSNSIDMEGGGKARKNDDR